MKKRWVVATRGCEDRPIIRPYDWERYHWRWMAERRAKVLSKTIGQRGWGVVIVITVDEYDQLSAEAMIRYRLWFDTLYDRIYKT